jgi:glycosyltransferase involved in cell wall biosynthesis
VIQRDRTRAELELLGHRVDLIEDPGAAEMDRYDLIHFWTGDPKRIDACKGFDGPRVASIVYVSRVFREQFVRQCLGRFRYAIGQSRKRVRSIVNGLLLRGDQSDTERRTLTHLLQNSQMLIALAEAEAVALQSELKIRKPHYVVPNGADPCFAAPSADPFVEKYGRRKFILCVGRFEPLKNQDRLIDVVAKMNAELVLVGRPHPHHPEYFERCRSRFGPRVLHIEHLKPAELASAYAAAEIVVQPSYYEAASLACLEAGLAGKKIITTDRSYHREYFGDLVWYCDPTSSSSIQDAIKSALSAPESSALRERIAAQFNWHVAAVRTLEAYEQARQLYRSCPKESVSAQLCAV